VFRAGVRLPSEVEAQFKEVKARWKEADVRYVGRSIPKQIPEGRVLMHNLVPFAGDRTPIGEQGFRAFTATKPLDGYVLCPCGWSGLEHYAHRKIIAAWRRKERSR
jgi:hypothetical protein